MLEVCNLSLSVSIQSNQVEAVSDVSLKLERGRVLGLVGESGCGKSLTAQAILRLGEFQGVKKSAGDILIDGENLFEMGNEQLRRLRGGHVAMIFQEPMSSSQPRVDYWSADWRKCTAAHGLEERRRACTGIGIVGCRRFS